MSLRSVKEADELKGALVLVRVDFNVPIENGAVLDDFRIRRALPTLLFLKEAGARLLILSHVGRRGSETLRPVFEYLEETPLAPVSFIESPLGEEAKRAALTMENGAAVLFENIRRFPEEEANDAAFACAIASLGTLFVNEAFSVSHRAHASVVGLPALLSSFAGIEFMNEVQNLSRAFRPPSPSLCVIGGAKFETKLPLLKKLFPLYDHVFIGGALANTFLRARGFPVGASLADAPSTPIDDLIESSKLMLPIDVEVATSDGERLTKKPGDVSSGDVISDIGHESMQRLGDLARYSASILWNGPLGNYEKGFTEGTERLAEAIADGDGFSIVGGGDTLAAIKKLKLENDFGFVSTGGGAMLDFLADETLPGIEALK